MKRRSRAMSGQVGRIWILLGTLFALAGLRGVWAAPSPVSSEAELEFVALQGDLSNRSHFAQVAHQTFHPASLILEGDRDPLDVALRRTRALLDDLRCMPGAPDLASQAERLQKLEVSTTETPVDDAAARRALFDRVRELRREIAFSNPLLDFGDLLLITRHRSTFNHMCDQYYGINTPPGGGLYVLEDPFGVEPKVRDLLAGSVVERGRLSGQKLDGGSFLSPDLSFDGREIVFAWVECTGDRDHRYHTDPSQGHWNPGRCYHIFKVRVDGSGLEQLTDGTWNDFDPCWLPSGRVALITERRGGYLRCGRVCPTYTLFDMAADGSDIRCLSYHETNEWNPSVTHDGRIVYTRWDYVDRHGCTAHLPWITTVDGRDSRAVHGNFAPRQKRPDMELDVRAIPGSHKFVATAAPHHGQAFGSLVIVDPYVEDDDAMAPVRRLTPEVGFPESQGGAQVYGTAWPLSERYHLCVYDVTMRPGIGFQGGHYARGNYGLYLVDAFGNRELIFRDAEVSCLSPMPFAPRPRPRVMPEIAGERAQPKDDGESQSGTVAVVNVYDSLKAWPGDTRIRSLRVIQILPMTVPSGSPPHEIGMRVPTGQDSVILARYVLGTVPVEEDGSAHFSVPAHKEIFFQALDDRGLAVQSMRSATYVQAGERLVCQGCHEPKLRATPMPHGMPLALRRPPSTLEPDVEGTYPFSYPRLVQPVLDQNCVECHEKHPDKPMNLGREPYQNKWYASYANLASKYGFYSYGSGHRTTPGQFGARASKLFEILEKGHHGVELPQEDLHRITLWLDLCSVFYGVYEKEGGEAQLRGEVVWPTLE